MTSTTPYSTVIYDRWGNRIEGQTTYKGLDTNILKNTFVSNKAKNGTAISNGVSSILIESNSFYSNIASSGSSVIENDKGNVEIFGNTIRG